MRFPERSVSFAGEPRFTRGETLAMKDAERGRK